MKGNNQTNIFPRIALTCFGIQTGLGVVALSGWIWNLKQLASFRPDYIPMAHSTAATFIGFGISFIFHIYWHTCRPLKLLAVLNAVFTLFAGLFSLIQFSTDSMFNYEHLIFGKKDTFGMVPTGIMSPVTASTFLLAGVSYLFALFPVHKGRIKNVASTLAAIVIAIGFVVILGYLYGTPLLYGGTTVPMALSTAITFVFAGTGLMTAIGTQYWPLRLAVAPTTCVRIIRLFMPIIITIVLVNGWLIADVKRFSSINPALMSALLCIVFLVISSYGISKIARRLGDKIDRTEDNYKHALKELNTRNEYNKVLIELGKYAITTVNLSEFMDKVAEALVKNLGVEYSKILELLPDGKRLLLRAGIGWKEGLVENTILDATDLTQVGYTLLSQQPIIVENLRTEKRFKGYPLLLDHGIMSGMSIIIPGYKRPFGILAVHTSVQRRFDMNDVNFLQSVAHMMATVISHSMLLCDLQRISFAMEQSPVSIVITDRTGNIEYANPKFQRLTGYTMEETKGKSSRILKSGEMPPEEYKRLWDTITSGKEWRGRFHNRKKNGDLYWEDVLISPVKDGDGKIINFIALKEDITHQVESEQRRQAQYTITETLVQTTSTEKIALKVIQTICECFGWDLGTLWVVDNHQNILQRKISWKKPTLSTSVFEVITKEITCKTGTGLPGRVWASGKPLWIPDVTQDQNFPGQHHALKDGLHGACCFPIIYENNTIGVMDFFSHAIIPPDNDIQDMMAAVGHQIGMFLVRLQTYEQLKKQLNHISILIDFGRTITSSLDLKVISNIFAEKAAKHLQADAVSILLYNQHTQKFSCVHGSGFLQQRHPFINQHSSCCREKLLEKETCYIPNLLDKDVSCNRVPSMQKEGFLTYYGIPLISKGYLIGAIEFFFRKLFKPESEWVNFVDSLSLQMAIAIDNAMLFGNTQRAQSELLQAYNNMIEGWSYALDLRDKETEGHSRRVTQMAVHIAQHMGMAEEEIVHVYRGALLHDIGKMGVPDNILLKPSPLTEEEWKIMRMHPIYAYEMLSPIPYLKQALDIPYCHHERWDGTGYPRGLRGNQIPLAARIFSIVDTYDALRHDRPYRKGMPKEKIVDHIHNCAGVYYDPEIVKIFIKIFQEGTLGAP